MAASDLHSSYDTKPGAGTVAQARLRCTGLECVGHEFMRLEGFGFLLSAGLDQEGTPPPPLIRGEATWKWGRELSETQPAFFAFAFSVESRVGCFGLLLLKRNPTVC